MNLYVGNLSPDTSEKDLTAAFSEFGQVMSVKVLVDPATGLPRGFGFVEMGGRTEAYDAILNLDTTYLKGTIISVKEAKAKGDTGGDSRSGGPRRRTFSPREGGGGYNRDNSGGGYNRDSRGSSGGYNRDSNFNRDSRGGGDFNRDSRSSGGYNRDSNFNRDPNYNRDNRDNRDFNRDNNRDNRDSRDSRDSRDPRDGFNKRY